MALILSFHHALGIPCHLLYSQFVTKTHYGLLPARDTHTHTLSRHP